MHTASLAFASRGLANLGWLFATLILFVLPNVGEAREGDACAAEPAIG
jgi:hypothetical protein